MPKKIINSIFKQPEPKKLSEEHERQKRKIYEKMNPRRRKFIDRIGYDIWDPFQEPNEPLDIRIDISERTAAQLLEEFLRSQITPIDSKEYTQGAQECSIGLIKKDEKFQGIFDFCLWYYKLLQKEGYYK